MASKKILMEFKTELVEFYSGDDAILTGILDRVARTITETSSEDEFKRKYTLNLIRELSMMVKNNDLDHLSFNVDEMKKYDLWKPLHKIIILKRLEEFKACKVVQYGKKYDVSDLKGCYLGNLILSSIGFGPRRTRLTKEEYEQLVKQINRMKYEIPITIKPTITERYFEE